MTANDRPKTRARLHLPGDLAPGQTRGIEGQQAHYLRNVMRAQAGELVLLFNEQAGEALARIEVVDKRVLVLLVTEILRSPAPEPDIRLLVAPVKRQRLDLIVEKATELGLSRLTPVITRHTHVERVKTDRLAAIAIEAAEQCGRLTLPVIDEPVRLEQAIEEWDGRPLYLCDERGGGMPIGEVPPSPAPIPFALLVGPEGGFAAAELDALHRLEFVSAVDLGPRILRADTAVAACLAVLQAKLGDWRLRR